VAGELGRVRVDLPSAEDLLPRLSAKLRAIEETLRADVALSRLALGALLGDGRIRVYRDGRIEGLATLGPDTLAAPRGRPGAASLGGSGGLQHTSRGGAGHVVLAGRIGRARIRMRRRLRGAGIWCFHGTGSRQ